jgi:hypothetical protein
MRLMGWTDRSRFDLYGEDNFQAERAIAVKRRGGSVY